MLIWAAAVSALALGSCAKSDSVDLPAGNKMGFYSYVGSAIQTKGTPLTTTFPSGSTAGLVAYADIADYGTAHTDINNLMLTSNGAGMDAEKSVFWPETGTLSFYAYAPYANTNVVFNAGVGTTAPGVSYTVPTVVADQVDVMVAEPMLAQDATTSGGSVALAFHHALTQVKFSAKTAKDYSTGTVTTFKVKSVTVKDAQSKGTLTMNYAVAPAWALAADKADFAAGLVGAADVDVDNTGNVTTQLCADNGILMLLPQTLGANVKVELVYTKTENGTSTDITRNFVLNKALVSAAEMTKWEANKVVNYLFTLSANEILFTGSITSWDAESTADIK